MDNHGQTSSQSCLMFMVGGGNPSFYSSPRYIESTVSPLGTVMPTQRQFSVQVQCMYFHRNIKYSM